MLHRCTEFLREDQVAFLTTCILAEPPLRQHGTLPALGATMALPRSPVLIQPNQATANNCHHRSRTRVNWDC